jgi:glutathione peroxidase
MDKIDVNGDDAHPLYQWLRSETGGKDIKWNFGKFLVGKDGQVIKRYPSSAEPEALKADVESALHA